MLGRVLLILFFLGIIALALGSIFGSERRGRNKQP